jgi:hypothetical protein
MSDVSFLPGTSDFVGAIGSHFGIDGVESCRGKIASAPERPGGVVP